ncbi:MAG: hypothetical protein QG635_844 [Bacteroidota bacterium]|nr:hypothetical protein [Bacteroidota bacterium]
MLQKLLIMLAFISLTLMFSCSDDNPANTPVDNGKSPVINSILPNSAFIGDTVTITGTLFGSIPDSGYVVLNGTKIPVANVLLWTDSTITIIIPTGSKSGKLIVSYSGSQSIGKDMTIKLYMIPRTIGSWWTRYIVDYDANNNPDISTAHTDSLILSNLEDYEGMYAAKYWMIFGGSHLVSPPFHIEETTIYATKNYINPGNFSGTNIPDIFTDSWGVIADADKTQWDLADSNITNFPVSMQGIDAKLNGLYTIKCAKGQSGNVTYGLNNEKSANCDNYQVLYSFDGKATATILGLPVDIPLKFTVTRNHYINKDIGMVKIKMDSQTINLAFGQKFTILGFETRIIDYKIK